MLARSIRLTMPSTVRRRASTRWLIAFAVASLALGATAAQAQDRERVRSQAEAQLRSMTPDEIAKKLRELGVSREEAIRRAAEYDISLDDYLRRSDKEEGDEPEIPAAVKAGVKAGAKGEKVGEEAEALAKEDLKKPGDKRVRRKEPREEFSLDLLLKGEWPYVTRRIRVPGFDDRTGSDSLQLFGYDFFELSEPSFEPATSIATPASYRLGAGDEVDVTVWGETKLRLQLEVTREGNLVIPDVGPVSVNGLTLSQFRDKLVRRMTDVYSGLRNGQAGANTFLDISLGKLRTVQVFVLGEVEQPGGYALSSMSTALHALYMSGGPTLNGSVRDVVVMRSGEAVGGLDVYDHMVRGKQGRDVRLEDGDVVLVKAGPKRVAIAGRVVRPAIYEIRAGESLGDLIALAGGLRFDSYVDRIHVQRVVPFDERRPDRKDFIEIDLPFRSVDELRKSSFTLNDGDLVTVMRIGRVPENRVTVRGPVRQPGDFALSAGARVRDIMLKADSLDRDAFAERGTLYRMLPSLRREVIAFNPRLAMQGDEAHNLLVQSEDTLEFYRSSDFFPVRTVSIGGAVQKGGTFQRYEAMRVSDLIVLAGGALPNAKFDAVEIARMDTATVEKFAEVISVNLTGEFWKGVDSTDVVLRDYDHVLVPYDPRFSSPKTVRVYGYLMLQGDYTLRFQGEKLADVIERAGGLRAGAYLPGARLFRDAEEGRAQIPVDFERAMADRNSLENVDIVEGDSIHVPALDNVVYVKGEVYTPAGVVYRKGASLDYYIQQAGGFTKAAEDGDVAVTLPNGRKWEPAWSFFPDPDILPGSTVFVPKKLETEDNTLPILRDMTTILASLAAITVALVQVTK